jgi:type II secretory pathway pseudopilin PulG
MKRHLRTPAAGAQRGAATLIVVMVLFFIISLVAAYTSRNLIFEQRTANNQMRSTQALEAAEAGLEWALTMLNYGRIDNSCQASDNAADETFRQRYLVVDDTGRVTPRPNPSPSAVLGEPPDLTALCVFDATRWNCSCPTTGAAAVAVPTSGDAAPAFRVRFQRIVWSDPANPAVAKEPGVVRIQVVGCTRLDTAADGLNRCLNFNREGVFNEGRVTIVHNLVLTGTATSPPQVALLARGAVGGAGTFSAYNTMTTGSGVTVQAGGGVNPSTPPVLAGAVGSPGGSNTMVPNDTTLSSLIDSTNAPVYTKEDRMFSAVFNVRPVAFRTQQAAIEITCGGGTCTDSDVRDKVANSAGRPLWVQGDLSMQSANNIGSAAQPVVMVVNGNVTWTAGGAGSTIFGLVYARTSPTWTIGGNGQIVGAAVAESDVSVSGNMTFVHDTDVMHRVRWHTGTWTRLPGSWKDYEQ